MTTKPAPTCCSRFQKFLTILFYLAGIALSGYAYFVEYQLENEPGNLKFCIPQNIDNTKYSSKTLIKHFKNLFLDFQDIKLCVILTNLIRAPLYLTQHMAEDLVLLEN